MRVYIFRQTILTNFEEAMRPNMHLCCACCTRLRKVLSRVWRTLSAVSKSRCSARLHVGHVRPVSYDIPNGVEADPRCGAHPYDRDVLAMGLRWNQNLVVISVLRSLKPEPDPRLISENQTVLEDLVKEMAGTGFHPSSTATMLPCEYGGVVIVDPKVYRVCKLRVVDSSIILLIPSAHLQALMYALAEKVHHISLSCFSSVETNRSGHSLA